MASPHALKHASDVITFIRDSSLPTRRLSSNHNGRIIHPLWFSRVNENINPSSKTSFLCLPSELLDHITGLLPTSDLASLALVNSSCRQLSRVRQFSGINLDYNSPATLGLRDILTSEVADRIKNNGCPTGPSLGVCIRSLVVASIIRMDAVFAAWLRGKDLPLLFAPDDSRLRAVEVIANNYFDIYLKELSNALIYALPNLEVLKWEDTVTITQGLVAAIVRSNVTDLTLCGVLVDQEFEVDVPAKEQKWKLRKLKLEIQPSKNHKVSVAPLCLSILRAAAPTLEELELTNLNASTFDVSPLRFPRLHSLLLKNTKLPERLLSTLIPSDSPQLQLRSLSVSSKSEFEYLSRHGHIDSLHTYNTPVPISSSDIPFITANPQIHSFTAPRPNTSSFLNTQLLPALLSFRYLGSLHLVWESKSIDTPALEIIGRITTLNQLWISAGNQTNDFNEWSIDHDALITAFHPLQRLRMLVFTRDTYDHPLPEILPEHYYTLRRHPEGVSDEDHFGGESTEERETMAWEVWHNSEMMKIAHEYGEVLGRLEWIFLGQVEARVRVCCEAHRDRYKSCHVGAVYGKPLEWVSSEKRVKDWSFEKAGTWGGDIWLPGWIERCGRLGL